MNTRNLLFITASVFMLINTRPVTGGKLFPEFKDWKLKIEETVYVPENLWELINGAAEIYLAYEFQDLHIGEYTNDDNEMIRVELYRHGNPENTFGIYSAERMSDYQFITVGIEGYTSFGALNFFTGNYYVKMIWSGTGDPDERTLIELAEGIDKSLDQANMWPDMLNFFPKLNRIPKSEGYSNENFLGYSYLHSAFTARYQVDDKEFTLFIIQLKSNDEVIQTIDKYFNTINYNVQGTAGADYLVDDPFNGKIGIGIKGNHLFGIYNIDDKQLINKYLDLLRNKITD